MEETVTAVTVSVAQGDLRGTEVTTKLGTTYNTFKGIPYAKPPLGSLRFRVSEYKKGYEGQQNADTSPRYVIFLSNNPPWPNFIL